MSKKLWWLLAAPIIAMAFCIKPVFAQTMEPIDPYEQGLRHYFGRELPKDPKLAAHFFEIAAKEQNLPAAQYNLGVLYEQGSGVKQDFKQAIHWYQKAAQQNHANAQYNLGYLLLEGFQVPKEATLGLQWLEKAAEQNHAPAQYQLGCAYLEGKGVEPNLSKALAWLDKASKQGHKDAYQAFTLAQSLKKQGAS